MSGKNFKIWGVRANVIGDQIMALPILNYLEKKFPDSYKYWCISNKISQSAPLYLNHPLIDKIKVTDDWELPSGKNDIDIIRSCNLIINVMPPHVIEDWYNYYDCVQETAIMAGIDIDDFEKVLSDEERMPRLYKWFESGKTNYSCVGYNPKYEKIKEEPFVAVFPFASYGKEPYRSPSLEKWKSITNDIVKNFGYNIYHFGFVTEPDICDIQEKYFKFTEMSFFDQIKLSLDSKICIGTDSGSMWVIGAYSHPSINLITNHCKNHNKNLLALAPKNKNGINIFSQGDINLIENKEVLEKIQTTFK